MEKKQINEIKVEDISYYYRSNEYVLQNINVCFHKGESISVMGTSGIGKTTFLKILGGLLTPTQGTIFYDDINYYALPEKNRLKFRRENFGFIYQDYELIPELTVYENIIFPILINKAKISTDFVAELCETLGLIDLKDRYPNEISGGQQQRTAIARALINQPAVLFCDEPTGNLDQKTSISVMNVLQELSCQYHTTLIVVTHDDEIAAFTGRHIRMSDSGMFVE